MCDVKKVSTKNFKGIKAFMADRGYTWYANSLDDNLTDTIKQLVDPEPKEIKIFTDGEQFSYWYKK